ncbi:esterase/lipase family protein [Rhodococcus sp. NPDC058521]|uniref:esterase/lipase family protein n=1 Tax=Rhodococcus sp. NPDC058521 TaxID=3346536 RepID=UPI00365C22EE
MNRNRTSGCVVRTLCLCVGAVIAGSGHVAADPGAAGPPQGARSAAVAYAQAHPGSSPSGSNDFDCTPSVEHREPVVLAHGTDSSAYRDWAKLAPMLAEDGYCVFALDYGADPDDRSGEESFGTGHLVASANEFGRFVDKVRSATGATHVDVVGYSQGANVTRYYVNKLGGSAEVRKWVGLASPTYGGTMYGLGPALHGLPGGDDFVRRATSTAVLEQLQGSPFLNELNNPVDTVAGVAYTTVGSRYDEMIQPYTNQALRGPGATNIIVSDVCPQNASGHFRAPYDPFTLDLVRSALDPDAQPRADCEFVPLGADIPQVIFDSNS